MARRGWIIPLTTYMGAGVLAGKIFVRISKWCGGASIAGPPPGGIEVDASQKAGEVGGGHLDAIGRGVGDAEGPAFESFGPDDQPVAVPIENLDSIATFVDEDEEVTGEGIEVEAGDKGGEPVEAPAHVSGSGRDVHVDGGAQARASGNPPGRRGVGGESGRRNRAGRRCDGRR